MVTLLPALGLVVMVIDPAAATALVVRLVPLIVTPSPLLKQSGAAKVPEPVARPSVRFNVFNPTVSVAVVVEPETAPEKVPAIVLDVGLGVKVSVFPPFVIVTLPELRTFPVKVPPRAAAVPALAVSTVPLTVTPPVPLERLNVPVWLALTAVAPVAFSAKTTKSWVQLGA